MPAAPRVLPNTSSSKWSFVMSGPMSRRNALSSKKSGKMTPPIRLYRLPLIPRSPLHPHHRLSVVSFRIEENQSIQIVISTNEEIPHLPPPITLNLIDSIQHHHDKPLIRVPLSPRRNPCNRTICMSGNLVWGRTFPHTLH